MFRMLIEDPEFRSLELPLSKSQREELEHRILTYGKHDTIFVWKNTIISGYESYDICQRYHFRVQPTDQYFAHRFFLFRSPLLTSSLLVSSRPDGWYFCMSVIYWLSVRSRDHVFRHDSPVRHTSRLRRTYRYRLPPFSKGSCDRTTIEYTSDAKVSTSLDA